MVLIELRVPLLIVNGNFQNLSKMTVEQLETFIPFMTRCCIGRGSAMLAEEDVPKWWVKTIEYKFPLKKPRGLSDTGYRKHLQSLVCSCYCFHNAHFLLSLCSKFCTDPGSIFLRSNEDNTTSVFSKENSTHIMTFSNENKEYDIKVDKSNRRCLLPTISSSRVIPDVYLCENCDVEFYTLTDMKRHESVCYEPMGSDDSDEVQVITHIKPDLLMYEKESFLHYFRLQSKAAEKQGIKLKLRLERTPEEAPAKRWVNVNMCLHKNRRVEFSSLIGRKMLEKGARKDVINPSVGSALVNDVNCQTATRWERDVKNPNYYMLKTPRVTFKKPKEEPWTHAYTFNKTQRKERLRRLKTGLDKRSRDLLRKCKELRIVVKRLTLPKASSYKVLSPGDVIKPHS